MTEQFAIKVNASTQIMIASEGYGGSFYYQDLSILFNYVYYPINGRERTCIEAYNLRNMSGINRDNVEWKPVDERPANTKRFRPLIEGLETISTNEHIWAIIYTDIDNKWIPGWLRANGCKEIKNYKDKHEVEGKTFIKQLRGLSHEQS